MLVVVENDDWRSNDIAVLDTDDWTIEKLSPDVFQGIKDKLDIHTNCDWKFSYSDNLVVGYKVYKRGSWQYYMDYVIVLRGVESGMVYKKSGECFNEHYTSVSVWDNNVMFEYTDKHYYGEDREEEFERIWTVENGRLNKGNYGDRFMVLER